MFPVKGVFDSISDAAVRTAAARVQRPGLMAGIGFKQSGGILEVQHDGADVMLHGNRHDDRPRPLDQSHQSGVRL